MRARPRDLARLLLSLALVGCGDDATPLVELGTGTTTFEPLRPGESIEVVAGPQGGHHFVVHARISGLAPGDLTMPGALGNPRTSFAALTEEGERVDMQNPPVRIGYRAAAGDDGSYELPSGRLLILDPDDPSLPDRLYGQEVLITVLVVDSNDRAAADERRVVAIEPVGDTTDAGPPSDAP